MILLDGTDIVVPLSHDGEPLAFGGAAPCHGCGATIYWFTTAAGKRAPHDADGISHFATCPMAWRFRRKRRG